MENENNFSSYNNIKRLSDEEIVKVWEEYLKDRSNKQLRDTLIVQYIYFFHMKYLDNQTCINNTYI